ncbi:unnamed protein product [Parnassius mnemosyne]|uniref:Uncharacterized protein n=1 Tax=Parnassius mnemosyne TaxID=213953 RepID=A0AAV1LY48_9NEOP
MEMRSRRKILLVHGIAEDKKENTSSSVVKILSDHLKVPGITTDSIGRSHRLGQPGTDKPRAVLVEFRDYGTKEKIWLAKKNLKGTGITLSEFLTKGRHTTFQAARQRFGVSRCWTRNGIIFVLGPDQVRHRIHSRLDLDAISTSESVTQATSAVTSVPSVVKDSRSAQVRTKRIGKK